MEGGKVLGVIEARTILVKYRDGHGVESVKLAVSIPGGELYFFGRDALDLRPAQAWLRTAVSQFLR